MKKDPRATRRALLLSLSSALWAASTVACDSGGAKVETAAAPVVAAEAPVAAPEVKKAEKDPLVEPGATAAIGRPAPDFTLPTADGQAVTLSALRGKRVVLEWFNPECPFVKKAHDDGPLKDLAARSAAAGIVWLAINSGAPGKQGHGAELNQKAGAAWGLTHPILLDESGAVGQAYGASNTPHVYVIDEAGALVYRGALDNAPMGEPDGGARIAYLEDALAALAGGVAVAIPETRAWGCSVKYAKK
ncbi:MAG: redoxin family protein [Nannocystis sp.]|nr:redoxin family protein [Nannocystis sp.]